MKNIFTVLAGLFVSFNLIASEKHNHAAHEHGAGRLNIAIEGQKIKMELEIPGDTAYGFEYAAKSATDKQAVEKAIADLSQASSLFSIDEKFKCEFKVSNINAAVEDEDHDGHRELHATYEANCTTSLNHGLLKIKFDRVLPRLHELRVQLISDTTQTSIELKRGTGQIKF